MAEIGKFIQKIFLKEKISKSNNNYSSIDVKPSSSSTTLSHSPPNQFVVRSCKLAFPFLVLANIAFSGYVMAKAKQRDDLKAKQRDEAKGKQREEGIAKHEDYLKVIQEVESEVAYAKMWK